MAELYVCADANFFTDKPDSQFKTTEDYNNYLIEKWNSVVKDRDIVLIVGDFSHGSLEETKKLLSQLNGNKEILDYQENELSQKITEEEWRDLGVKLMSHANGWIKGEIEGKATDVILVVNPHCFEVCKDVYFCAAASLINTDERFKNNCLNLSTNLWDYTPVKYNSIPQMIDNAILFESMNNEEINLNEK